MIKISRCGALIPLVLWMVFAGCSSDDSSNPSGGGDNCTQACAKADALHCTNDVAGACTNECQQASMATTCKSQWDTLMTCSASATFACDTDGEAKPQGCDTQENAYFQCLFGGLGDAGSD